LNKKWAKHKSDFIEIDVRGLKGNFLPAILKKAGTLKKGEGIKIIQNFEPIPLYSTLEKMGFEHETEKQDEGEYAAFFYRLEEKTGDMSDLPLKPIVMTRYADIDTTLADLTVNYWQFIWNRQNPAIELKIKFLLSLANAVGANRFRQATRELIKAYSLGVTTAQLDELFSLFVWNQGVGHFSSEIAQSPLFTAYQFIKKSESNGMVRKEIMKQLKEQFGEKNPDTGFVSNTKKSSK